MATSLADSPPAAPQAGQTPPNGQAPSNGSNGAPHEPPTGAAPTPAAHTCARCGYAMAPGQDWCLECGAGAPGSLGTPGWRSAATIFGVVAVLVLGAAAAAVAALTKSPAKAPVVITTVAQAPAPATTTPTAPGTTPTTPGALATIPKATSTLPLGTVKPPKIPLTAVTPKASEKAASTPSTGTKTTTPTSTTPSGSSPSGSNTGGEKTSEESQQSAILLDTNAASTYNPYGYPAAGFGDPSLAIDGDTSTAWTAEVNPSTAPKMAEGLLIDLKGKQKVATLQLVTSTPGMRVQVYGANVQTAPTSITDPAWTTLTPPKIVKKKRLRISLRDSTKAFTFITVWISQAPQSALGTPEAPGHVDINEVELFPAP
jgi:hypothetical protein